MKLFSSCVIIHKSARRSIQHTILEEMCEKINRIMIVLLKFFMAALWFLEMVLMILFYHDLQAVTSKNNTDSNFDDDFSTATSQTDNNERSNSKKLIQTSFWSMVYNGECYFIQLVS